MDRKEQIAVQASKQRSVSEERAFINGAQWSDNHPSEQTLTKAVYLYKRWLTNQSGLNMMEFIKKNWNIEI